jgi:hypothetical protein
MYSGHGFNDKL